MTATLTADAITLYSIPTAAALLGCSRDHLYDLMADGDLPYVQMQTRTGRSLRRLRHRDIVALINKRTIGR